MDKFITSQCQLISNNSIRSEKPKNQGFQPCSSQHAHHVNIGMSTTQT